MLSESKESYEGLKFLFGSFVILVALTVVIFGFLTKLCKKKAIEWPSNVVIIHQFPRGLRAPSISPFALKLETWLVLNPFKILSIF